jgi:amino acid permease
MDERIQNLEREVEALRERNRRVESEKAWETSFVRVLSIALITYVVAGVVLYSIGVTDFFLAALVPVLGYILSTQSLPRVKRWWMEKFLR